MATQTLTLETRRAVLDDCAALTRLGMQLGYDSSEMVVRKRLARLRDLPSHAVFVAALRGNEVVGWTHVELRIPLHCDPYAEVIALVIDSGHRRLGIGRALMERVLSWSQDHMIEDIRARAQEHREDALTFYEELGFELYKEQQVYRKIHRESSDTGNMPTLVD